jgi:alanyl-tRNA synthetase
MASRRLDYDDAYTTSFKARALRAGTYRERTAIELDETYFYPESGGQLGDHGTLDAIEVQDVQADDDGAVWHLVAEGVEPGRELAGEIDWARRFDHMQQHTGQHMLSAAFERVLDAPTLSSTLGEGKSVIEVALADADWRAVERVEKAANQVVWDDRAIERHWVDDEGVKRFKLRKPPAVSGRIRIVEIPEWDISACGGTHTRRTGEVGAIKIVRWERVRGNLRFEFLCGARALSDHAWRTESLLEAAKRRTLKDRELIAHLERAAEERDELKKRVRELSAIVIAAEARAETGTPPRAVVRFFDDRAREELRTFVMQCLEAGAPRVVTGAGAPEPALMIAQPKGGGDDLRALVPALSALSGGKGGGSPDFIQLAATNAPAARLAFESAKRELAL